MIGRCRGGEQTKRRAEGRGSNEKVVLHRSLSPLSTATILGASWPRAALSSSVALRPNFSSARSESCRPMRPQARIPMPTPRRVRGERFRYDLCGGGKRGARVSKESDARETELGKRSRRMWEGRIVGCVCGFRNANAWEVPPLMEDSDNNNKNNLLEQGHVCVGCSSGSGSSSSTRPTSRGLIYVGW